MSSSDLTRWGGLAAMVAGVAFIVDILFVFTVPEADWTNVVYIVAALLLVAGMVGLHALQKDNYGRIGRGGFWTVVVATLAQVLGIIVFLLGSRVLNWLVFPVGFLAVPVGLILYGAATLQARVLPRWCGLGLIIVPPVTVVLGDYGGMLFGLLWLALGYVLWSRREAAATEQPSRVR
jgi:hypothetical protein